MRLLATFLILSAIGAAQPQEPTKREIETAYRSKSGEAGFLTIRKERWRVKEVRGWSLRFKRLQQQRSPGVITLEYEAVANRGAQCADYRITDTMVLAQPNPQMKPILVVEPTGLRACR